MSSTVSGFNIDEVIGQIAVKAGSQPTSTVSLADFGDLDSALAQAAARAAAVGDLPPKPATLRGSIGFLLVQCIRRALFWFTPGVRGFHESVLASLNQARTSLGLLATLQEKMEYRAQELIEHNRHEVEERVNRIVTIQQQVIERLDRIESEVSRLSLRANVLAQLQSSLERLNQRIDSIGGHETATRRETPMRAPEKSVDPGTS